MRGALATLLLCALAVLWTNTAVAQSDTTDLRQEGDFGTSQKAWNGLSTFAALAGGEGLQVLESTRIDWEELDSDDVLVLLYPTNYVDPTKVVSFIRNGGRVLIADDFGTGHKILAELGGRRNRQFRAERYQGDQIFAPIAGPTGIHPLSAGIVALTTNHPSALSNLEGIESIFSFASGDSVVAAGELGLGRYVALADPSVLINRMLQFEGNLQFSINLLRYLIRPGESDRVIVLAGPIALDGEPRNSYDDGTWRGSVSANVAQINGWLDEINLWMLMPNTLRLFTLVAALILAVLLFLAVPQARHKPLDGAWTRAAPVPGPTELAKSFSGAGPRTSYLLPAAIARDNVNSALELVLEEPDPLYSHSDRDLLDAVSTHCSIGASRTLGELLPRLRGIPQRAQAAAHWQPRFVSLREFEQLQGNAETFLKSIKTI
ncbi:MAG: DUF4350 domain-containing protein [Myxococcales bacterium]|nr:DUF4350 domain-containing protein [Myxococcales bacterium]